MTNSTLNITSDFISTWTYNLLLGWGFRTDWAAGINLLLLLSILAALVYVVQYSVRRLLRIITIRISKNTRMEFFRHLLTNRFPHYLAMIAPLSLVNYAIPLVFSHYPAFIKPLNAIADVYMVFMVIWMIMSLVRSGSDTLRTKTAFRDKPMDSYLQVFNILLFFLGIIVIFSNLTGKSPVALFTAMGAASAVLMLMFKDTIMGFVASIQVTSNDMVRIGDWITMSKYGADGDVIEINLTTVKVRNFDKTITTIPTYALISDSFQNQRGMFEMGGRRIKRAIHIKQSSIRFVKPDELEYFRKIQSLASYIEHRQRDIDRHNERTKADKSILLNGRNLTNAGLFRKFIDNYVANHTGTHKNMTLMVRQLAPTPTGLPIELYVFANTTKWVDYEHIMADIFDHLLAAAPYFGLQIFETQSSGDVRNVRFLNELDVRSDGRQDGTEQTGANENFSEL